MKFNNKFKYIWWGLVLLSGIYMIYLRYDHIRSGNAGTFDTVLIAIVAALMLIPFFSEINILGVQLKQEIASVKNEVKKEIFEIREIVRNVVDVNNHNNISSNIYFDNNPAPSPENQLSNIEEFIKKTMSEVKEQNAIGQQPSSELELQVSDETMLLFSARYNIEKELRRIWFDRFSDYEDNKARYTSINRMISDLIKHEVLPPSFNGIIKEIYAVCSPAIHGEKPTKGQVDFIKDISRDVINTLKVIR